jgi:hypothetical protein
MANILGANGRKWSRFVPQTRSRKWPNMSWTSTLVGGVEVTGCKQGPGLGKFARGHMHELCPPTRSEPIGGTDNGEGQGRRRRAMGVAQGEGHELGGEWLV